MYNTEAPEQIDACRLRDKNARSSKCVPGCCECGGSVTVAIVDAVTVVDGGKMSEVRQFSAVHEFRPGAVRIHTLTLDAVLACPLLAVALQLQRCV